jgi:hypothetical protein
MKLNGVRDRPPPGVRHTETTRAERIKVLTLRDDVGMTWAEIGRRLNIDRRAVQKVVDGYTVTATGFLNNDTVLTLVWIYQAVKEYGTPSNRK